MLKLQLWPVQTVRGASSFPVYYRSDSNCTGLSWFIVVRGRTLIRRNLVSWLVDLYALFQTWLHFSKMGNLYIFAHGQEKNVPVNNLQKTELLLFCILKSLKARDCLSISGFQVAEWWNMIGLSASIPPLLPLSLFLPSSCLQWYNHSSFKRIKNGVLFFYP